VPKSVSSDEMEFSALKNTIRA